MLNVMLSRHVKVETMEKAINFISATHYIEDRDLIEKTLRDCQDPSIEVKLTKRLTVSSFKNKNETCFKLDVGTTKGIVLSLPTSAF